MPILLVEVFIDVEWVKHLLNLSNFQIHRSNTKWKEMN
jgi:hypothetical protein